MPGAGSSAAGSTPAGYGTVIGPGASFTRLMPDWLTGLPQGGRYINPNTGDYQFTADGRTQGMQWVPQLVQIALTTLFGTSALPNGGAAWQSLRDKGPNFQRDVASVVASALAPLVQRKLVQLVNVTVQDSPDNRSGSLCQVVWKDLTTGKEQLWPPQMGGT